MADEATVNLIPQSLATPPTPNSPLSAPAAEVMDSGTVVELAARASVPEPLAAQDDVTIAPSSSVRRTTDIPKTVETNVPRQAPATLALGPAVEAPEVAPVLQDEDGTIINPSELSRHSQPRQPENSDRTEAMVVANRGTSAPLPAAPPPVHDDATYAGPGNPGAARGNQPAGDDEGTMVQPGRAPKPSVAAAPPDDEGGTVVGGTGGSGAPGRMARSSPAARDASHRADTPAARAAKTNPGAASSTSRDDVFEEFISAEKRVNGLLRYRVLKEFARGGLGRVLLARDEHLSRDVAVKEMLPRALGSRGLVERFFIEAQITGQLQHPGIVPIYELGIKPDGSPFYSMKLFGGRNLEDAIASFHAIPFADPTWRVRLNELLQIFVGVCNAMAFAHSKNVIHRDLKPLNVMLGDFGEAIVVDWGLAKVLGSQELEYEGLGSTEGTEISASKAVRTTGGGAHTEMGTVMGTPRYMSPEQAAGNVASLDARSDIFALGAILYCILTSEPPFEGYNTNEVLINVRLAQYRPARSRKTWVPPALEAIISKALRAEVGERYSTALELAQDVQRWLANEPVSVYVEPWWIKAQRWVYKHRTHCAYGAALVVVAGISLGGWSWWEYQQTESARRHALTLLSQGRDELEKSNYPEAKVHLTAALAKVEHRPALEFLTQEANRLLEHADARLADSAAFALAQANYDQFQQARDAAFLARLQVGGLNDQQPLARARDAALAALVVWNYDIQPLLGQPLLGEGAEKPTVTPAIPTLTLPTNRLNQVQVARIRGGVQEMLLILADLVGRNQATEDGKAPDKNALAANHRLALTLLDAADRIHQPLRAMALIRAQHLDELGERQTAKVEREKAQQWGDTGASDLFLQGLGRYFAGDLRGAIELLDRCLRQDPDHVWAKAMAANSFLRLDLPDRAVGYLAAWIAQRPTLGLPYVLRGLAYARLGEAKSADLDFDQAEKLGVDRYSLLANRGAARIYSRAWKAALDDLTEAAKIQPQGFEAQLNLAEAYRHLNQPREALAALDRALTLAPHLAKGYRFRAELHISTRNWNPARADYQKAISLEPADATILADDYFQLGILGMREQRHEEALAAFAAATRLRPDFRQAHQGQADALLALQRGNEALQALNRALLPPKVDGIADTYRKRGFEQSKVGDFAAAVADYTNALQWEPRSALTLGRRGWAFINHSANIAQVDFDQAIQLEPANPDLFAGRGYAGMQLGQIDQAMLDARKAVELADQAQDPNLKMGVFHNCACLYAQALAKWTFAPPGSERDQKLLECEKRALELLNRVAEALPAPNQAVYAQQALADPGLEPMRHRPTFQTWIKRFKESK